MRIYKLNEARNKERFFNRHKGLTPEQKEELIKLYSEQYIPDDIIDWNKIESYSYDDLYNIVNKFRKERDEKRNKKNLSKAIEGRDYLKIFENKNSNGTEYLYLPLTWIGSKYLASDHFLPKIKVPSKVMNARDFSDNSAKNTDLSPGAKWCISLWTLPDWVRNGKPFKDLEGKELRHEGKRYWLDYTSGGAYFLFYFRDYSSLDDIDKKIAFTLRQGSSKIEDITLADDTRGTRDSDIEEIQEYWNEHSHEYISQIQQIQEVSKEKYPEFMEYEKQKENEAKQYFNRNRAEVILKEDFIYNEKTGRYDSKGELSSNVREYLFKNKEIIVPLGVINGDFNCSCLNLESLKNGPTEVKGFFDCSGNNLTSLEYSPKKVGGYFDCSYNQLTTLKGVPRGIGGGFNCSYNELTSLEYAPEEIGGFFNCNNNQLITLEGTPNGIVGFFNCGNNKLKTLKGAPEIIEGDFTCYFNSLTSLEYAPKEITGTFWCDYNNLKSLKYAPKYVGRNFNCTNNNLTSLEYSPEEVGGDFNCSVNKIKSLKGSPRRVKGTFTCSRNNLTSLEYAPEYIGKDFDCSKNKLTELSPFPEGVEGTLIYYGNPLQPKN